MFPDVPFERFDAFHCQFDGEADGIWQVCGQCGGRCEIYKIGTLLPGEKEYMAAGLGIPVERFEARYLDRLVTPRGTVDVLKLKAGCPFLDTNYHCVLAELRVKPVLCEIYPVVFDVEQVGGTEAEPELSVSFGLDERDCPLMHQNYQWSGHKVVNHRFAEHRRYFKERGISLLEALGAPAAFYWIVAQYDDGNFDYRALQQRRPVPVDQYGTFTLEDILACDVGHPQEDR